MKVLLGIAGSDETDAALEETVRRAVEANDDLTVAILEETDHESSPDEVEARARDRLDEADIDATIRRVSGDPGSELVEIAEREGFDRLVIGGGQRSPMGKIQLGSITEFVLLNAQVSVTLVR
ncbi:MULTISPECIES: universal stress protein [Halostella]|uniref:universal stress protein n=1 Tax=Halostella TaxID=1843185 RepID=UPI0010818074|nr:MULTISPECIES: universal stress protein [Halostella]